MGIPDTLKQIRLPEPCGLLLDILECLSHWCGMRPINILSGRYLGPVTLVPRDSSPWSTPCFCDKSMCCSCRLYFIRSSLVRNEKLAGRAFQWKIHLFQVHFKTSASTYLQVRNLYFVLVIWLLVVCVGGWGGGTLCVYVCVCVCLS